MSDVGLMATKQAKLSLLFEDMGLIYQSLSSFLEVLDTLLLAENAPITSSIIFDAKRKKNYEDKDFIGKIMELFNIDDRKSVPMTATLPQLGMDSFVSVEVLQFIDQAYCVQMTVKEIQTISIGEMEKFVSEKAKKA